MVGAHRDRLGVAALFGHRQHPVARRKLVTPAPSAVTTPAGPLPLGTIFGCWMFCQIPYGDNPPDDYAVIIFKVMIGITFAFVLSGFIVIPLREATKPLIYNLHKRAMKIQPRLRRAWSI